MKNLFLLGIGSVLFILGTGCSKSPESYNAPAPVVPFDAGKAVPTDKDLQKAEFVEVGGVTKPAIDVILEPISNEAPKAVLLSMPKCKRELDVPLFTKWERAGFLSTPLSPNRKQFW